MTKDEMKNRISMALKDPILQQGFEIICKENAEFKETVIKMNNVITETFSNLNKAKEIIEELLDTQSCLDPYKDIFKDRVLKAEQFLKEV